MKTKKYKISSAAILGGAILGSMLTGCQDTYDAPLLEVPQPTMTANTTLAEFKSQFADEMAVETPYKDPHSETPYILKGRVISSDASGNIYKSLVIQDETGALAFSINQSSMYTDYRLGQEVLINATGLWMGQYNSLLQMGWLGEYNGSPQITFMAYDIFNGHTEKSGVPNQDFATIHFGEEAPAGNPYITRITLDELNNISAYTDEYYSIMSQLVEIPDVSFKDAGQDPPVTFSTYQDNADRYITNESGQELNVRCSGYSSFYNDPLPEGLGTVRGILSRYGDSWQLMLRGKEDLVGFSTKGTRDNPFNVEEARELDNSGRKAWVSGYIIGSVRSGVENVASFDEIITNVEATEANYNVVIGQTNDTRDLSKIMVINLPADSKIRQYVNLLDNPGAMGKQLLVNGELTEYLGVNGVTGVGSGFAAFSLEGSGLDNLGTGTETDPFKPGYFKVVEEEMEDIWIEGYIVGFVEGRSFLTGSHFDNDTQDKDFVGNNFILGEERTTASTDKAVPVNLSKSDFRSEYDLTAHPEIYGKRVLIKGNASITLGTLGITNVAEIRVLSE